MSRRGRPPCLPSAKLKGLPGAEGRPKRATAGGCPYTVTLPADAAGFRAGHAATIRAALDAVEAVMEGEESGRVSIELHCRRLHKVQFVELFSPLGDLFLSLLFLLFLTGKLRFVRLLFPLLLILVRHGISSVIVFH